jgi:NAD+ synthase
MNSQLTPPKSTQFSKESLQLDPTVEIDRIVKFIRENVFNQFRHKGVVIGISGGIDSSVVLALCVSAFEVERILGLMLPERESSSDSVRLAKILADHFGVDTFLEDITPILEGSKCYTRRDQAIQRIFPKYSRGWKAKIILPGNLLDEPNLNIYSLVVTDPNGIEFTKRLPLQEYRQIVSASNLKQRTRMNILYYHAELRNYAVVGTGNKNEHDLGFFVKYGDGGVDIQPIGHLYKSQIYQLAENLDIPEEIQLSTPTTDTYPGGGSQEEFFFRIPFDILDIVWYGFESGVSLEEIAVEMNLSERQVKNIIDDIIRKKRATEYLRQQTLFI